jgi:hypothetical protein
MCLAALAALSGYTSGGVSTGNFSIDPLSNYLQLKNREEGEVAQLNPSQEVVFSIALPGENQ